MQLIPSLHDTISIVAVHHEDQTLRILKVMPPQRSDLQVHETSEVKEGALHKEQRLTAKAMQWQRDGQNQIKRPERSAHGLSRQETNLVLTSYIPHREANVLVLYGLHVEACTHGQE